jgi:hypothetical protein
VILLFDITIGTIEQAQHRSPYFHCIWGKAGLGFLVLGSHRARISSVYNECDLDFNRIDLWSLMCVNVHREPVSDNLALFLGSPSPKASNEDYLPNLETLPPDAATM